MRFLIFALVLFRFCVPSALAQTQSTKGIEDLVRRRLPTRAHDFSFALVNASVASGANSSSLQNDRYTVSNGPNGTIHVEGNTPIALASGLGWYFSNVAHVGIYWSIGSRLHLASSPLPRLNTTYTGSSIVPWRYHFNTVTFSYTAAFWTSEDWELQLDWMALKGINLPLAWVGQEKILMDVFIDAGFTEDEVLSFLSGPAFQAWNRFGNIQGSWGGQLPMSWINGQFDLQKKIVARMVELGMTPVLPCFTGFVPRAIDRVFPDAAFVNGSQWSGFPSNLTNVTFLEPTDSHFAELQTSFITKQTEAYGNVTHIYTLDQYNENDPYSGDVEYLQNVTRGTWQSLKAADPDSVWLMQGWLFYSSSTFWTDERIEAYLSGVEVDSDMLILDLFSESQPQWQRTNSYYGKPWIWCQLHGYGGNMGLYGQLENVTVNPIAALANSSSLVGFGLTMEGQEGNEIMYDILLDQAWSPTSLDTKRYFYKWVTARYSGNVHLPQSVYAAWDILCTTVYNNTDLNLATAVTKSIFELAPSTSGLLNRTGHHATTITYQPADLQHAWSLLYNASKSHPSLLENPAFALDLVDVTRQIMANAFDPLYISFMTIANDSSPTNTTAATAAAKASGAALLALLSDLDTFLLGSEIPSFSLSTWLDSARAWATAPSNSNNNTSPRITNSNKIANVSDSNTDYYFEYTARNQITLWGPTGQISDYSSRQWGGLVGSYYLPRWSLFVNHVVSTLEGNNNNTTNTTAASAEFSGALLAFEEAWQWGTEGNQSSAMMKEGDGEGLKGVLASLVKKWPSLFSV